LFSILSSLLVPPTYIVAGTIYTLSDDQSTTSPSSETIHGLSTTPIRRSIDEYLIEFNLDDLVITQLEEQLRIALGANRIPYAKQLAVQYGYMFDAADSDDERAYWEQKSIDLTELVPEIDTTALRLNLAKASYVRAEYAAEQYRLRAIDLGKSQDARRSMLNLAIQFKNEFRSLRTMTRKLEEAQFNSDDSEGIRKAGSKLQELDSQIAQTAYYAAWALYYESWLSAYPNPDSADESLKYFGWILMGRFEAPYIEETPLELISYEHIARSILGVSLAHSAAGRFATALDWVDLLTDGIAPANLIAQIPAYHLSILFERAVQNIRSDQNPRWEDIHLLLDTLDEKHKLTPTIARLVAVLALDASTRTGGAPEARELANKAITLLAELNQLPQVLELSQHFKLDVLGTNSFYVAYVLALQAHERARTLHGNDVPTTDILITRAYQDSEKHLIATIRRPDASHHPKSITQAKLLAAWSRYFVSDYETASIRFGDIAELMDTAKAEHALWMRIVCLDNLISDIATAGTIDLDSTDESTLNNSTPSDPPDYAKQLQLTMILFLERYPSSIHAGKITYRLVANKDQANQNQVDQLLAVPINSDAYDQSQSLAERKLYRIFLDTTGLSHISFAEQYLDIARPLLHQDAIVVFAGNAEPDQISIYLARSRRMLHVLLTRGIAEVREARRLLDRLSTGSAAGLLDLSLFRVELEYRNFQIHVLEGDFETASTLCDAIWISDDAGNIAEAACREMLSYAVQDWKAFPDHPDIESKLQEILQIGTKLRAFPPNIDESEASSDAPPQSIQDDVQWVRDDKLLIVFADAGLEYLKRNPDNNDLRLQIERSYHLLLTNNPTLYRLLKASAILAEYRSDLETAIQHYRTALTTLSVSQTYWEERLAI